MLSTQNDFRNHDLQLTEIWNEETDHCGDFDLVTKVIQKFQIHCVWEWRRSMSIALLVVCFFYSRVSPEFSFHCCHNCDTLVSLCVVNYILDACGIGVAHWGDGVTRTRRLEEGGKSLFTFISFSSGENPSSSLY